MKTIFATDDLAAKPTPPRRGGRWHGPAEILRILEQINTGEQTIRDACKAHQITMPTYYRWMKMRGQLAAPLPRRGHRRTLLQTLALTPPAPESADWPADSDIPQAANAAARSSAIHPAVVLPAPTPHHHPGQTLLFPAPPHLHPATQNPKNNAPEPPAAAPLPPQNSTPAHRLHPLEQEIQHLRHLIVQLSADNLALRKTNTALAASLPPAASQNTPPPKKDAPGRVVTRFSPKARCNGVE